MVTESGLDLNDWHSKVKERFNLADMLEACCPDRAANGAHNKPGTFHTICPFETEGNLT